MPLRAGDSSRSLRPYPPASVQQALAVSVAFTTRAYLYPVWFQERKLRPAHIEGQDAASPHRSRVACHPSLLVDSILLRHRHLTNSSRWMQQEFATKEIACEPQRHKIPALALCPRDALRRYDPCPRAGDRRDRTSPSSPLPPPSSPSVPPLELPTAEDTHPPPQHEASPHTSAHLK